MVNEIIIALAEMKLHLIGRVQARSELRSIAHARN